MRCGQVSLARARVCANRPSDHSRADGVDDDPANNRIRSKVTEYVKVICVLGGELAYWEMPVRLVRRT